MQVRGPILHRFFNQFSNVFSCKKPLKPFSDACIEKYQKNVFFSSFWVPTIDKKGPKRDAFFRLAVQRGVRRHPGTPRGRILTLQGGLFEPPGRHFRTSWGVSGTILKGLGGFLGHLGLMLGGKLQQIGANSRKQQQTATEASSKQQQTAVIANRN